MMNFQDSLQYAKELDSKDTLAHFRNDFFIPEKDGKPLIYFTGNSLGLQPKSVKKYIDQELTDWANLGVEGHFHAKNPWFGYHHALNKSIGKLVGGNELEVVAMNTLSVNLNLLLVSFYRPKGKRTKIIMEADAFPSDHYAIQQQVKFHGLDVEKNIILLKPRAGAYCLETQDILEEIKTQGETLALVMLGGVNYYTGQFFELDKITAAAHAVGAYAGYDLAHAVGNIPLQLHNWNVDFATWCSYKYLNSGPGGVSGIFVHEKHAENYDLPRFAGWWGNDEKTRFLMQREFVPQKGAAGWQQSNAQILPMAAHRASLEIFDAAGIENLRAKSEMLTGYLAFLLEKNENIEIITPKDKNQRGCQLSLVAKKDGKKLFQKLQDAGVIADWREPNVIRVAPVPLYNTFEDVWHFTNILQKESAL